MKIPKKVIEKISPQLMFVSFVLAVLMFAVGPVSAAPPLAECYKGSFCDQDSDEYIRAHKKCWECGGQGTDCDDSFTDPTNTCAGDPSDGGDKFTVALTDGPFLFDPIEVFVNSKGNLKSTGGPIIIHPPGSGASQEAWDQVFRDCVRIIDDFPLSISVNHNQWGVGTNSDTDIHIDLSEIFLQTSDETVRKEIQIHLRGDPGGRFLPDDDPETTTPDMETFDLDGYTIWGKPLSGSGRGWDTCYSYDVDNESVIPDGTVPFPISTLTISIPPPPTE
jgi:hypothetical protein